MSVQTVDQGSVASCSGVHRTMARTMKVYAPFCSAMLLPKEEECDMEKRWLEVVAILADDLLRLVALQKAHQSIGGGLAFAFLQKHGILPDRAM